MSVRRSIAMSASLLATVAAATVAAAQPAGATGGNLECRSLGGGQAYCDLYKLGNGNFINQEWDVNGAVYAYGTNYVTIDCGGSVVSVGASYQDASSGAWYSEFTKSTCY